MTKQATHRKVRYLVTQAFDYLTAGREYDFSWQPERRGGYVNVRRTDGSGIGTYLRHYQLQQALQHGWLQQVA